METKPGLRYQRCATEEEARSLALEFVALDSRAYSIIDTQGGDPNLRFAVAWGEPSDFPKVDADRIIHTERPA